MKNILRLHSEGCSLLLLKLFQMVIVFFPNRLGQLTFVSSSCKRWHFRVELMNTNDYTPRLVSLINVFYFLWYNVHAHALGIVFSCYLFYYFCFFIVLTTAVCIFMRKIRYIILGSIGNSRTIQIY